MLAGLGDGPLTADEIVRATGLSSADGSAALMELELAGAVTFEDGVYRAAIRGREPRPTGQDENVHGPLVQGR